MNWIDLLLNSSKSINKSIVLILIFLSTTARAQNSYLYEFNGDFNESSGKGPELNILGESGRFVIESLPELDNIKRKVYRFQKNCGLNFDIQNSDLKLFGSYSIELYFKLDALDSWKRVIDFKNRTTDNGAYIFNGKLNFYKIITSDIAPVVPNQYTHYMITYDAKQRMVNIYADGICKITFFDEYGDASIDARELHFFYDDLVVKNEASAGAVAFIKLFDYTVPPEKVKFCFEDLKHTVSPGKHRLTKSVIKEDNIATKLSISVVNMNTNQPVLANISIENQQNIIQKTFQTSTSIHHELKKGNYLVRIKAQGYAESILELRADSNIATIKEVIKLMPITIGVNVKLEHVHFKQGFAELLKESYPMLDHLVKLMKDNSSMEIELSGHTDNQGNSKLNLLLSEERVKTIKEYLVNNGVIENRISGVGYGDTKPVVTNDSEKNRQLNRRVEVKVLRM